ncbi:hypothetical protein [Formosa sp. 4Alg 33]|uniref:hypothetical protein n=1 Tax=Formosa sp. 4Alg 33 TaxID=3382189 RepID=UPI003D9C32D3
MTYLEKKEKEKHLLYLIEQNRLICLKKVANDYECSLRTIERMLEDLRKQGYDIVFCRKSKKYFIKKN